MDRLSTNCPTITAMSIGRFPECDVLYLFGIIYVYPFICFAKVVCIFNFDSSVTRKPTVAFNVSYAVVLLSEYQSG
jgi:hypothetical protein